MTPRILVAMGTGSVYERGYLLGLYRVANAHGWNVLCLTEPEELEAALETPLTAFLVPPGLAEWAEKAVRRGILTIGTGADLSALGMPWAHIDDAGAGRQAAEHLLAKGLRSFAAFDIGFPGTWRVRRAAAFRAAVLAAGYACPVWGPRFPWNTIEQPWSSHEARIAWLRGLPKPCGVFAINDLVGRDLLGVCHAGGIRVPEDVAVVAIDNDEFLCQITHPALSSVAIPWEQLGGLVAGLIEKHLAGEPLPTEPLVAAPLGVVARRSSDMLAIDDPEVAAALRVIEAHATRVLTVAQLLRAVPVYRNRLERSFRQKVGRTMLAEIRRVHAEQAKHLLVATDLAMSDVAERSGFPSAKKLSEGFRRETGMTPSAYRRRFRLRVQ